MNSNRNAVTIVLVILTALMLYLSYLLVEPFLSPILFAILMAIAFHPLHAFSNRLIRNRSAAAIASTLVTVLLTAVPLLFLALALSGEISGLYQSATAKTAAQGGLINYLLHALQSAQEWLGKHLPLPSVNIRDLAMRRLEGIGAGLVRVGASVVSNVFAFITDSVIACVVLFFVFRDGERGLARLSASLPLPEGTMDKLQKQVSATVVANLYGGVAVGAAQGLLAGLAYWVLGVGSPVLWGVVTGICSLVPMVGSALVWVPAAIMLMVGGHMAKGVVLLAWGGGVVAMVDNFIRPWIVSGRVQMHPLYVFFALLGGVQVFGIIGLFAGPVILSLVTALLGLLAEDIKQRGPAAEAQ
jgi:predicted PurR-regulated permease PerM